MLINFHIQNYKSFKERNSLSLIKSLERQHEEHIINNQSGFNLLKGAIIYGANASGKSNFIDALDFSSKFIVNGHKDNDRDINVPQFLLDGENQNSSSSFEYEFIIDNKAYSYGFVINKKEVLEEWLCEISKDAKTPDKFIYTRENGKFDFEGILSEKERAELEARKEFVKPNELFLTKSLELNTEVLKKYIEWFKGIKIIRPSSKSVSTIQNLNNSDFRSFLTHLLKVCDTGIEDVTVNYPDIKSVGLPIEIITDISNDLKDGEGVIIQAGVFSDEHIVIVRINGELKAQTLQFIHKDKNNKEVTFKLSQESDGTKRLIDLSVALYAPPIHLLVIDELDRSLHPALTQFLCKNFLRNNSNKQLIITTHETSLLNTKWIRRDEIWFVNKEKNSGISSICPLSNYKQRYDKELRKAYLDGRYHGVPVFGDEQW